MKWTIRIMILATAVALWTGCGPGGDNGPDPEQVYQTYKTSAMEEYEQGDLRGAIQFIGRALATKSKSREPYDLASRFHIDLRADEDAVQFFDITSKWQSTSDVPWPLYFKGYHLFRLQRHAEALECFRIAVERAPEEADAHYRLGLVQEVAGDMDAALESLHTAWNLDMRTAGAAAAYSRILLTRGDLQGAEGVVMQGLEFAPTDPGLIHSLALIRLDQERPEQAEMAFLRVLDLQSDHLQAREGLIRLLDGSGRKEEAARHQRTLDRANDYMEGRRRLMPVAAAGGGDPGPALALAELELTEKQYRSALRWFDVAATAGGPADHIAAGKAEAWYGLSEIENGDRELASVTGDSAERVALARAVRFLAAEDKVSVREALGRAGTDSVLDREFLRRASDLYALLGDVDEAERLRRQAASAPAAWER